MNEQERPALPDVVAGLLDPAAYPHSVDAVELVQTHISYVFLAGEYAYKVKKRVDFGFLDFTTLARRRYYCRQEVVLNRRLCSDTYLGLVPIAATSAGYRVAGRGKIVEYAVQMRRLPQDRMLDQLISHGQVSGDMIDALADRIARFHEHSAHGPAIDRYGSPNAIASNWDENFRQVEPYVGITISPWQDRLIRAYVQSALRRRKQAFRQRILDDHIRDCHGDLRSSAVCFRSPGDICVYDCIEFNRRFRYSDVASDVAFLAMDLDAQHRPDLSARFVQRYVEAAGDPGLPELLDFYRCYRAYVRGKVESFRLDQFVRESEREDTIRGARHYFDLACRYISSDQPPLVIAVAGLSGTGKSSLAEAIAAERSCAVVSSDITRKELARLAPVEHRFEDFGLGMYSTRFTRRTYRAMMAQARPLPERERCVILDATFSQRWQRDLAAQLATATGSLIFVIECVADEATVRERLQRREREGTSISDARWETYLAQRASYEPIAELDDWQHITVNTARPLSACLADALASIAARLAPGNVAPAP